MNLTKVLYFTTSTVIDWVIFTRPSYRHIIVDSLAYCQSHKGLNIYAWVLMSNHLHMIADTNDDTTLGDVMRDFKKFTNKKVLKALQQDEQESRRDWLLDRFWFAGVNDKRIKNFKEGNYVEEIYTMDFLLQKLNYIHQNPVRAEIVAKPEDYLFSSAMDYAGEKGLLKVELIK